MINACCWLVQFSQVAPSPREQVCLVEPRIVDMEMESQLRKSLMSIVLIIGKYGHFIWLRNVPQTR